MKSTEWSKCKQIPFLFESRLASKYAVEVRSVDRYEIDLIQIYSIIIPVGSLWQTGSFQRRIPTRPGLWLPSHLFQEKPPELCCMILEFLLTTKRARLLSLAKLIPINPAPSTS